MFGYIKPFVPDLRVREHELYRAIYCGLCRSMGRCTGCASRLTLSYDFAFLAAVRLVLEKQQMKVSVTRCAASPLRRRPIMEDNPTLAYCAAAAAILTREKVRDDISDSSGLSKLPPRLLWPAASGMAKKALRFDSTLPAFEIMEGLSQLSALEKEKCTSVDSAADCFGRVLSVVFSHGLSGSERAIAASLGHSIGRTVYVLDAADDMEKDRKKNNYNPLNLEPISPESLSTAVRLELKRAESCINLMDFEGMTELRELICNIIYEGLPKEADRIFNKSNENIRNKDGSVI
ncbi:MAG: hypothetical protein E7647_02925 [Ruminococcaceae bacterium]|nr:hypothetical protein [Oscillospiraceae bacterium]